MSSVQQLLDAAGRRRSPATLSEFHAGRAPGNKGQRYAADPPTVDEIIAVMRHAAHARYGNRLNGLIVVLWRAGLRINGALSLTETDLEEQRGSILVRHGKNDRRRQVGMDAWGWSSLHPWLAERATLPVGPLGTMVSTGPTAMVGKPANVATADSVIVVPAGVGMEQLTDSVASRRRHPDHGFTAGLFTTIAGRRRVVDARGVRRRRGPRAEPESIPARVRGSDGGPVRRPRSRRRRVPRGAARRGSCVAGR